jgi:hypothetical protein
MGYDFGNNLVNTVTKGDWPEITKGLWIIYLWDEGYKSGFERPMDSAICSRFLDYF